MHSNLTVSLDTDCDGLSGQGADRSGNGDAALPKLGRLCNMSLTAIILHFAAQHVIQRHSKLAAPTLSTFPHRKRHSHDRRASLQHAVSSYHSNSTGQPQDTLSTLRQPPPNNGLLEAACTTTQDHSSSVTGYNMQFSILCNAAQLVMHPQQ